MKSLKNQSSYVDFVMEQIAPLGEITSRSMFGGHCLYCDGVVFALIAANVLYLKADGVNQPEFEARGLEPFRPFEDRSGVMRYYAAPPEIFEDPDALKRWVSGAVDAGRRSKKPKKQPTKL
jgi:DNA transformation protein